MLGVSACEESQTGVTSLVEKKLGAVQRTVEERREATKSGGLVQARKTDACWQGCKASLITESKSAKVAGRKSWLASRMAAGAHPARDHRQAGGA
jgi:hypothetical protein